MFHIIDDNEVLREVTSSMVNDAGYKSLCFESGDEYLKYIKSPDHEWPTAILSDITMPGINGYDLTLEIRERNPFQIIILVSGDANHEGHVKELKETCYVLRKPFTPDDFFSLISDLIIPCHECMSAELKKDEPQRCSKADSLGCPFFANKITN